MRNHSPHNRHAVYVALISLLLAGLFTGQTLFFAWATGIGAIMLVVALWSFFFSTFGLRIERNTRSYRAQVGRKFTEQLNVVNASSLVKTPLEIQDASTLPNHRMNYVTPFLLGRTSHRWTTETLCTVRGEFQLGPLTVTSVDPFGLFSIPKSVAGTERLLVYPTVLELTQFALPAGMLSGGEARRQITQNTTANAVGVRDYVQGDSINRIHWKSTARRNKLIVKEFEIDPLLDVWLFVDFSQNALFEASSVQRTQGHGTVIPSGSSLPHSTEEYSVVIAASVANFFIAQERSLGFAAYAPHREVYAPERGIRQLTRILETLAVARSFSRHSLQHLLVQEAHRLSRGTTIVLVTSSVTLDWIIELQLLMQRGLHPVCVYVEPSSFGAPYTSDDARGRLSFLRIPTYVVRCGDDIATVLSQPLR
jgi:uncharacterized protein (DUF58 family)